MKTVEEMIKWLEYSISFCKWGINSLRDFPPIPKNENALYSAVPPYLSDHIVVVVFSIFGMLFGTAASATAGAIKGMSDMNNEIKT
jgi:hypothetical protein